MSDVKRKDTRKGDRHRPGYWKEYGRIRRAREKANAEAVLSKALSQKDQIDG